MRLDMDAVQRHAQHILRKYPRRRSGSEDLRQAMDYLASQLMDAGIETTIDTFPGYSSTYGEGRLEVISPRPLSIPCIVCGHIRSTPPEGVVAELIDVGPGAPEHYEGKAPAGKVALAAVSYAPPTTEKAKVAEQMGCSGLIISNWGYEDQDAVSWRALKGVWGNPTLDTFKEMPDIPAVSIGRQSGDELRRLCAEGPVTVRIVAVSERQWVTLRQSTAIIPGSGEDEDFLVLAGHVDSWEPGATDNSVGNGVMIELAKALKAMRLRRSVRMVFFDGHEICEATGSSWFVDRYWDDLRSHGVSYFNIDQFASGGGIPRFDGWASLELMDFLGEVAGHAVPDWQIATARLARIGDQSFFGIGIPAIAGHAGFSEEDMAATQGALFGWYNHTNDDTEDKLDFHLAAGEAQIFLSLAKEMAGRALLPMRFTPVAALYEQEIRRLIADGPQQAGEIGLQACAGLAAEFSRAAAALDAMAPSDAARITAVNAARRRLSRITTPLIATASGTYAQDRYGASELAYVFPKFKGMRALFGGSGDRRLALTTAMRERNELADALRSAIEVGAQV